MSIVSFYLFTFNLISLSLGQPELKNSQIFIYVLSFIYYNIKSNASKPKQLNSTKQLSFQLLKVAFNQGRV